MKEYIEKWPVVNRLIALENEFQQYKPFHGFEHAMYRKICEAEIAIGKTDAADVVERKRGEWEVYLGGKELMCSACKATFWDETGQGGTNFCPNCGADMREVDHD